MISLAQCIDLFAVWCVYVCVYVVEESAEVVTHEDGWTAITHVFSSTVVVVIEIATEARLYGIGP